MQRTWRRRWKRLGKTILPPVAAGMMFVSGYTMAYANPTGGTVTSGSATINSGGSTMTINQTTNQTAINWQSFNIGSGETVRFVQPSVSSVALNRVIGTNASSIYGTLSANGRVFLVNPNGILFAPGAQVNTGALVASALTISDSDFQAGKYHFSGGGSVVNQGTITAANGGYVALLGGQVSNQGVIVARQGTAALGAGSAITLDMNGDGLVHMAVNQPILQALAENKNLIQADGGTVVMTARAADTLAGTVVNNSGIIQARSVSNVNGVIQLDGGTNGTVTNSGTLDASGKNAGETGGTAKVLGNTVGLAAGSHIDVSGDAGGGTALIGGNFHGAGPEQNAQTVTLDPASTITADAVVNGDGGNIAVWSDGRTDVNGSISARGGATGGNGGQVETSGKTLKVGNSTAVNTLAPKGTAGNWLLDPDDFTIWSPGYTDPFTGVPEGSGDMDGAVISAALMSGNVTIQTTGSSVTMNGGAVGAGTTGHNGDINVAYGAGVSWNNTNTLTLSAYGNINIFKYACIESDGVGNIILRADNAGRGSGTVTLDNTVAIWAPNGGTIQIYYNPTSYSTPTNYAAMLDYGNNPEINGSLYTFMAINLNVPIQNKTYDGTTTATINGGVSVVNLPSGVTIDTSGATVAFADKNAGTNKVVILDGLTLDGVDAGQYYLNRTTQTTATINKADLTVSGVTVSNKTYDATAAATLGGTATVHAFAGDIVTLDGTGVGTFADKNVSTGKAVTVSGYTLSGTDAGNYNLVLPTGLTADITKANLTVSGVTASNKTYDTTITATLGGTAAIHALGSDVVTLNGTGVGTFADKNVGNGKAVTVTGYSLSGADAGNYNIVQPVGVTADITKANLAVSGVTASNKTYDATADATLGGTAGVTALGSDTVTLDGTGVGTFADKNVGSGKAITVTGYSLSGADAGNYNIVQPTGLTADITKANLTVSGVTASNKTYDAADDATLGGTAVVTALGSDTVWVSGTGTGTFSDKNVGTGKAVTVSGYTLSGTDAGNYNLVLPTGLTADITKANLTVSGVTASNKTYDTTITATLGGTAAIHALGSDVVTLNGTGVGTFADKNVASAKAVTVTGYSLSGADAGNYNIVQPVGVTADITKANLTVSGVTASNKIYDATATATLGGTAGVTALVGDTVTLGGTGVGTFADKNVGNGKAITVTGYNLSGADAGNYNLVQPTGLTADITQASLTVSGVTANNKAYDATITATLGGTAAIHALGSDAVTLNGTGVGTFADQNVGNGKAVTVTGYTLSGADAGNYNIVQPVGVTADITKANLTLSGSRIYDGTTAIDGSLLTATGVGGETFTVTGAGDNSNLASKNVQTGSALNSVTGLSLGTSSNGGLTANYNALGTAGSSISITAKALTLGGITASNKVYDSTTAATLNTAGVTYTGLVGGDDVALNGTGVGTFDNKNVGTGKAVTVTGYTLGGADAGNYTVGQPTGLTADITKADLPVSGVTASNKTYDTTITATLGGTAAIHALGSDVVTLGGTGAGTFADQNVGSAKAVTVTGYSLSGVDAGNYNIVQPVGVTADITKANLMLSGSRIYDGTTAIDGSLLTATGVGGETFTVTGAGDNSNLASKNVQTGSALNSVTGLSLGTSSNGGLTANYNALGTAGSSISITAKALTLGGITASNKVYDSTTTATLNTAGVTYTGLVGGDAVTLSGAGVGTFADKTVGSGKVVTVTGYTLGGADAGNYTVGQPTGLTADITKANLTVTGITVSNKVYDSTTAATLNTAGVTYTGLVGGDMVIMDGMGVGAFADKNVGSAKAVTVTGYSLSGADAGNYNLVQPTGLTADITKANLTLSGSRIYDGTTAIDGSLLTATGVGGETFTVTGAGDNSNLASKNVQTGSALNSVTGLSLGTSSNGGLTANYNALGTAGSSINITAKALTLSGITASNKVYDSTTTATLNTAGVTYTGLVVGDTVTLGGAGVGTFADKTVGNGKAVTVTGYTLGGADAGNYTVGQPTGLTADITKANLTVTGVTASNKTYDATITATLGGTAAVTALGSDTVSVSGTGVGTFADKNVGNGKAVTVTGYTLSGADAGNYNVVQPAGVTADITKANLTVTGVTANNKTYDATTAATLGGTAGVTALGSDVVSVSGTGNGTFSDKNVGSGKAVTVTGYTLSGADAGNYNVIQPAGLTAGITKANLTVTGVTASNKTYDATTAATLGGTAVVTALGSDVVSVSGTGVGTFADKNVGSGKAVTVTGYTLSGADAGNYAIVQPVGVTADITKAGITVSGITANDKIYDGTTSATVNTAGTIFTGRIGSDAVMIAATGVFADANAGNGKPVILTSTYGGADAGNYTFTGQTGTIANITPAPLTVIANDATKASDGSAYRGGNGLRYSGFVNHETSAVLMGTVVYGGSSQGAVNTGSYAIVPSGLSSGNYAITYVNGVLTITDSSAYQTAAGQPGQTLSNHTPGSTNSTGSGSPTVNITIQQNPTPPANGGSTPQGQTGLSTTPTGGAQTISVSTTGSNSGHQVTTNYSVVQTAQTITLVPAAGSNVNLPPAAGSLAVYRVVNDQPQPAGSYQLNVGKDGLQLSDTTQPATAASGISQVPNQGVYVELSLNGETGRYYVGVSGNALVIRPDNDRAKAYETQTDSAGNKPIVAVSMMAVLQDLGVSPETIQSVYIY